MTIRVTLSNGSGPLDSYTSPDVDAAREELAHLLLDEWELAPGDTITVAEIE